MKGIKIMRISPASRALLTTVTGLFLCLPGAAPAQAGTPNGLIAMRCTYDICTISPDGSDVDKLRAGYEPDWSPDGRTIAFVWGDGGKDGELATMAAGGGHFVRLTRNAADDRFPSWSPDGRRLAYSCGRQICTMKADGSNRVHITSSPGWAEDPDWSPKGDRIAFVGGGNGQEGYSIFSITPNGADRRRITMGEADTRPAWSPSGELLAYIGSGELMTVQKDGTHVRRLTAGDSGYDEAPAWSPDGHRVAFARSGPASVYRLWVVNGDGTGAKKVSNETSPYVGQLSWQRQ